MNIPDLAKRALDHALFSIEDGDGPLIPFTLVFNQTKPEPWEWEMAMTRFAGGYLEDDLQRAQASIDSASGITSYAIAFDGYVTMEGRKWDAILVDAGDADSPEGVLVAQRYELHEEESLPNHQRNVAVGEPVVLRATASRLWAGSGEV